MVSFLDSCQTFLMSVSYHSTVEADTGKTLIRHLLKKAPNLKHRKGLVEVNLNTESCKSTVLCIKINSNEFTQLLFFFFFFRRGQYKKKNYKAKQTKQKLDMP